TPATREDFESHKADIVRELRLRKQADTLIGYVKRLRDEAEGQIQIDPRYVAETADKTGDG
ncbi:MAG TPA: hypothetical protein VL137_08180, partial [Polyangiaceae bacterium]|nr:hypothetical protein [Polyangiaceae bacterium]